MKLKCISKTVFEVVFSFFQHFISMMACNCFTQASLVFVFQVCGLLASYLSVVSVILSFVATRRSQPEGKLGAESFFSLYFNIFRWTYIAGSAKHFRCF